MNCHKCRTVFLLLFLMFSAAATEFGIRLAGEGFEPIRTGSGCQEMKIILFSTAPLPEITLNAELRGYRKNPVRLKKSLKLPASGETELKTSVEFDVSRIGLFEFSVVAWDASGKLLGQESTTLALIPEVKDHPREMGICTHYAQNKWQEPERAFDYIRRAGFSAIRDELYWHRVEPERGRFIFPQRYDSYLALAVKNRLEPLIVLNYGNDLYTESSGKRGFPQTPETRRAFVRYTRELIARYGDRVKHWELWNEPNGVRPVEECLPLLKEVYRAVKEADPEAKLISCGGAGAGGGPGGGYIRPLIKNGGLEFQDGFSIHPYMSPYDPDTGYPCGDDSPIREVSVPAAWRFLDNFIGKNRKADGSKLELWVTEIGWPSGEAGFINECLQGSYLVRLYLYSRRSGAAARVFWYDFLNDGIQQACGEHNFGILRADFSPKPAYAAAVNFAAMLGNKPFVRTLRDDAVKLWEFGSGEDEVFVLWTTDPRQRKFPVPLPPDVNSVTVTDWQGGTSRLIPKNGAVMPQPLPMPQYLKFNRN